ncbi:MAG TPA: GTP 3',8-cyclase MoaA [Actinomycetota bacterium]|nr:GTP 3',8-cyclase MoaA [Actinomycetota bacterium]
MGDGSVSRTARSALRDSFGRTATDLRVSVTDRCNFRCRYCMPAEGLQWMPKRELLDFEEIARVVGVLVESGIRSLKVTGGEPLVRRDLATLIRMLRDISSQLDISLTTNGYLLADHAEELAAAGLDRVTVSCDSLIRHRFEDLTLRDALTQVMRGLDAAAAHGLEPIKVNTVMMRGRNDDEAVAFAELARRTGYEVRFIEYMPLDAQGEWASDSVVPAAEVVASIAAAFELVPVRHAGAPATVYAFADGSPGTIGVIPSVTNPFCDSCDRLRLTADGQLRACLFALEETDLRGPLRAGAGDDELADLARTCVAGKWAGHRIGSPDFVAPGRSMSMIGG